MIKLLIILLLSFSFGYADLLNEAFGIFRLEMDINKSKVNISKKYKCKEVKEKGYDKDKISLLKSNNISYLEQKITKIAKEYTSYEDIKSNYEAQYNICIYDYVLSSKVQKEKFSAIMTIFIVSALIVVSIAAAIHLFIVPK